MKLIVTNYPEGKTEEFQVENNPERPEDGTRTVDFSRELWIEREDFMEHPVKGYFRLFPGNEVRLKTAYIVRCTGCKRMTVGMSRRFTRNTTRKPGAETRRMGEK